MPKVTGNISLPPKTEWVFEPAPDKELGLQVVWESLRCLRKPPKGQVLNVVIKIATHASTSDWFQRFCRREGFLPLKLLAWIAHTSKWPTQPWSSQSSKVLNTIEGISLLPPLIFSDALQTMDERYESQLNRLFDLLMFPLAHATRAAIPESVETSFSSGATAFNMLRTCGALKETNFLLNVQQYNRKDIVAAFDEWVSNTVPKLVEKHHRGGRVDPAAWLPWLGAYRLCQQAKDSPSSLLHWKLEYSAVYKQHDKSISRYGKKFRTEVLVHLVPGDLLPD